MHVESVNVGLSRIVSWQGRTFATGIFKSPVGRRVAVDGINLAGDEQADRSVHGGPDKAVYAYAREDIDWWAQARGSATQPGDFGENLTTIGIDLATAVIGERWRVGTAVLEVSEPRVPCYKLAMRMDDATFPKRFGAALRTGAYLRIVSAGEIGPGDSITIFERPAHEMRIVDVARTYLFEHAGAARFLEIPQLGEKWLAWARDRVPAEPESSPD